jgi:hypothetical protein
LPARPGIVVYLVRVTILGKVSRQRLPSFLHLCRSAKSEPLVILVAAKMGVTRTYIDVSLSVVVGRCPNERAVAPT